MYIYRSGGNLTHDSQLQAEGALTSFVGGDAGVGSSIILSQWVNDERVDAVFSHEHPVSVVWINGSPIQ